MSMTFCLFCFSEIDTNFECQVHCIVHKSHGIIFETILQRRQLNHHLQVIKIVLSRQKILWVSSPQVTDIWTDMSFVFSLMYRVRRFRKDVIWSDFILIVVRDVLQDVKHYNSFLNIAHVEIVISRARYLLNQSFFFLSFNKIRRVLLMSRPSIWGGAGWWPILTLLLLLLRLRRTFCIRFHRVHRFVLSLSVRLFLRKLFRIDNTNFQV